MVDKKGRIQMKRLFALLFTKMVCSEIKIRFSNSGSYFDFNSDCIYLDPKENDCGFLRHLSQVHKCGFSNDYSLLVWSILHEIGHYYTLDFCDDDSELRLFLAFCDGSLIEIQDAYFNLESEWEATEWAIDFIIEHSKLCKIFSKLLK